MLASLGKPAEVGRKLLERRFAVRGKRLPKDFAVLRLGRAPVAGRALLQPANQLVIEITYVEAPGHVGCQKCYQ